MSRSVLCALATVAAAVVASPALAGPTEDAARDAVAAVCMPIVASGHLDEARLAAAGFTPGAPRETHEPEGRPFSRTLGNGDRIELFVDMGGRRCSLHIHGAASAREGYVSQLYDLGWRPASGPRRGADGWRSRVWQTGFRRSRVGIQLIGLAPDDTPGDDGLQVVAYFSGR